LDQLSLSPRSTSDTIRLSMSIEKQIEELLAGASQLGIPLTELQTRQFEEYIKRILAWNKRRNIVSRKDEERIGAYHIVDSLSAFRLLPEKKGINCLDVGSGAGFPGIPLKIVRPHMRLGLVEPRRWRHLFLENLMSELHLPGVTLFRMRVEDLPAPHASYDAVLVRAVASLKSIVPLTLPHLSPGAILIAYKSGDAQKEIEDAEAEILAAGGKLQTSESISLPLTGVRRVLVVIEKL
jgi:16S rRNA (guanine527-N7)-methyltransferase